MRLIVLFVFATLTFSEVLCCISDQVITVNPIVPGSSTGGKLLSLNPVQNCQWKYRTEIGYKMQIKCNTFRVGSGTCTGPHVVIDGKKYCGNKDGLTVNTASNSLTVTTVGSGIGRLVCTVNAVYDACNCGRRKNTKIVGGTEAILHEFPYQAALIDTAGTVQCGAVIIDPSYVLTAAHCVSSNAENLKVVVGEHQVSTATETSFTQVLAIKSIIIHDQYKPATGDNDIALVRTEIKLNENVGVVCLPFAIRNNTFPANEVIAAGWGTLDFGERLSDTLQKVDLTTVTDTECKKYFADLPSSSICTYREGKDTCQHDSGGSLYLPNAANNRVYSIGIVSRGEGCAGSKPSVSTRVTSELDWILKKATGATFCEI